MGLSPAGAVRAVRAGEVVQMDPLQLVQTQRVGDRVEYGCGDLVIPSLLQPDVVVDPDPGQLCQFLTP